MGSSDYYQKRKKRKTWDGLEVMQRNAGEGKNTTKKKKVSHGKDCCIRGHTTAQCRKKHVDVSTELPDF
jgi:hypothetical protein